MSKFEDFFEDFMQTAKSVAGSASRVTGEVVDMGKVRYQLKQTQWDIEKTYSKLGAIVYESKKGGQSLDEVMGLAISEIDTLTEKLEELEEKLRTYKKTVKCPDCGRENDRQNAFCSRCGASLRTAEEEPEAEHVEAEVVEEPKEN